MIKRLSSKLWFAATSIPPIRPENLLPIVIMLILWVALRQLGVTERTTFVLSVVIAEAYAIWRTLPEAAESIGKVKSGKPRMLRWPVAVIVLMAGIQFFFMNPVFTQRLITSFSIFFLVVMVLGMRRERDLLDRVAPNDVPNAAPVARVSLLRINAIVAAMVIVVNESLIYGEPIAVWIAVMPIFILFLHAFYWFMVMWVMPSEPDAP